MIPELHLPWNVIALLLPLVGSVLMLVVSAPERRWQTAVAVCLLTFVSTIGAAVDFTMLHAWEAHDHFDFLGDMFHTGVLVIDELNAPLLPLAALLFLAVIASTLRKQCADTSFSRLLFQESMLLGLFGARHPLAVILLSTLVAVPAACELRQRGRSVRVYLLHLGLSALMLVIGWLLLPNTVLGHPENAPGLMTVIAGTLLTLGALLRCGTAPMHCWITDLFDRADMATSLLTVLPMSGAFVVMRMVLPIAPSWALQSIALLSLITAVYAAGMSLIQTDPRRFFCYLFLSHAALVPAGLELLNPLGLTGALCVWISTSLAMTGLGITLRAVEARFGRLSLQQYHGLAARAPFLAVIFLVTGLAAVGFPGTIGFIGSELLIEGAVSVYPLMGTAVVVAAALNGIAIMSAFFRIFTGLRPQAGIAMPVRRRERIALLLLLVAILAGGLYPQPGVVSRYPAAIELIRHRDTDAAAGQDSLSVASTVPTPISQVNSP